MEERNLVSGHRKKQKQLVREKLDKNKRKVEGAGCRLSFVLLIRCLRPENLWWD